MTKKELIQALRKLDAPETAQIIITVGGGTYPLNYVGKKIKWAGKSGYPTETGEIELGE